MIEPVLDGERLLADILLLFAFGYCRCFLEQSLFFLCFGLGLVLVQQLERLRRRIAVQHISKLRDRGGNLKAKVENLLLSL